LAALVPSSPGYVGPYEAAVILALSGALGLSRELALSYAVLMHVTLWLPVTVWGVIEWSRLHLSLRQVEEAEYESDTMPAPGASERFGSTQPQAHASVDS
jgi:hypothetical protein